MLVKQKDITQLYKENRRTINYYCSLYSKRYNIDIEDLYSVSNELFMNCIKKYFYNQITFSNFFHNGYKQRLLGYCLNQLKNRKRRGQAHLEVLLNTSTEMKLPIKNEIKMKPEIKLIINEIINFLLDPNYINILTPYIKIKKQKKIKPSSYIVKKYFNDIFGYSYCKLEKAVQGIKLMLREEMI